MTDTCYSCDSKKKLKKIKATIKYDFGGAPFVTLKDIPQLKCDDCGETFTEIPKISSLHKMIAELTAIHQPGLLSGDQIRFIRKYLGHSTEDYADIIKMNPKTLSRIENDKQKHSESIDKTIRTHALIKAPDRNYEEIINFIRNEPESPMRRLTFKMTKGELVFAAI